MRRASGGGRFCNELEDPGGVDGLGKDHGLVALTSRLFDELYGSGMPGNEQYLTLRMVLGEPDGQVDAIHPRHHDVGDEDVRLKSRCDGHGFLSVVGDLNDVAVGAENEGEAIDDQAFIVNDEDARGGGWGVQESFQREKGWGRSSVREIGGRCTSGGIALVP